MNPLQRLLALAVRQQDALVAEHVMGWGWFPWRHDWHKTDHEYDDAGGGFMVAVGPVRKDNLVLRLLHSDGSESPNPYCSPPPHYTWDVLADFKVLQRMQTLLYSKRYAFTQTLDNLLQQHTPLASGERIKYPDILLNYLPGDYSQAALLALAPQAIP